MWTLTDRATPIPLADIPAPAGAIVGEAFDHALDTNPIPLFMQAMELNDAKAVGPILTPADANAEAARNGVKVAVPETGMSQRALGILIQRRKDDAARDLLFSRSPGGAVVAGGEFAAGLAGSLMDPLNLAAGMIPVLGGTKYAAMLAEAGTAASRAGIRLGVGGAEGLVGAGAVEAPTFMLHRDLQDDYTLGDSLANIAFGTFASAGLRAAGGALRDLHLGIDRARAQDALRAVEPQVWASMRAQAANAEERSFWSDLEQGFQRGEGMPDGMRASFERDREQPAFGAAMDEYAKEHPPAAFTPQNGAQVEAAISDETHASALRASVAQAVDGRVVDPTAVVRTDEVFGDQRISQDGINLAAQANMRPETRVSADPDASRRADATVATASEPKAKAAAAGTTPDSPAVSELRTLMSAAEARLRAEGIEGEALTKARDTMSAEMERTTDYERAWQAVANCLEGK